MSTAQLQRNLIAFFAVLAEWTRTAPLFDEDSLDIPLGYGIELNWNGQFLPYCLVDERAKSLKDALGIPLSYAKRQDALDAIDEAIEERPQGEREPNWQDEANSNYYRDLGIRSERLY
jgi:hypothetical protein